MFIEKISQSEKFAFIAYIKGLAEQAKVLRRIQAKIKNPSSTQTEWTRLYLKTLSRHYLLTYAMIRGNNYRLVEPTGKVEAICADTLLKMVQDNVSKYSTIYKTWNLEKIKEWLAEPMAPQVKYVRPKRTAEEIAALKAKAGK